MLSIIKVLLEREQASQKRRRGIKEIANAVRIAGSCRSVHLDPAGSSDIRLPRTNRRRWWCSTSFGSTRKRGIRLCKNPPETVPSEASSRHIVVLGTFERIEDYNGINCQHAGDRVD
jgi:hypothetical protein